MRSHYCGHIDANAIGEEVEVAGWVHRRRDHGGVIFVDLRDREGLLQIVFDPDTPEIFAEAERIRSEYVLAVRGKVRPRPEGTVNPNLASGEVEVLATDLTVLNESDKAICDVLGPELKKHGLLFVGIDVIGDKLTEINITSPTGIQEINRLDGVKLEADLVDLVLAKVTAARG